MPSIAFALTEHMLATSSTWPSDMVAAANQAAKRFCPDLPSFSMVTVTTSEEKPIRCHTGIKLYPDYVVDSLDGQGRYHLPTRPVAKPSPHH